MKQIYLITILLVISEIAFSQALHVNAAGEIRIPVGLGIGRTRTEGVLDVANSARIGNITSRYHSGYYGLYGSATSLKFNNTGVGGLIMEQGHSESAGLYLDGDYAVIWSPGDQGYLLKLYDEDGMLLKWYVDGAGFAVNLSDSTKKENIQAVNGNLEKINMLSAKKYNYKKNDAENIKNSINKSGEISDTTSQDENKYDSAKKEYYGFLA